MSCHSVRVDAMTRPEASAPFRGEQECVAKKKPRHFDAAAYSFDAKTGATRPVSSQRERRREFDRTFLRTCARTAAPEPPHISVTAAAMDALNFSVTMRFASACAVFPPPASFIIRSPTTRWDSKESIVASYQNLNIASVPQVKA